MKLVLLLSVALLLSAAPQDTPGISPALLSFSATAGVNPQTQNITIGVDASTSWTASTAATWLSISQTSGTGPAIITVTVTTAGMPPGIYSGKVQIAANGSTSAVTVTVMVAPAPGAATSGNIWYVSPSGTAAGDGSADHPWDIVTGFSQKSVKPGDTVWMRGGKYGDGGANSVIASSLVGTPSAPIIVRAYPGERPIIDAWLQVGCCDQAPNPVFGSYTWFWGLEFASYNPDRTSGTSGPPEYAAQANHQAVDSWGAGTKLINCIVHDTAGGISLWDESPDAEAYGNLVYNVGGYGTDRGHGHGFYLQNAAPAYKHIYDNISFNNFGEGMQLYGSNQAYVQNFHVEGNVSFNNGTLGLGNNTTNGTAPAGPRTDNILIASGNGGPLGIIVVNNYTYHTPQAEDGYNDMAYNDTLIANDLTATGNYFIGGRESVELFRWNSVVFRNNTLYSDTQDEISMFWSDQQNPSTYNYDQNRYFGSGHFTTYAGCVTFSCSNGRTLPFAAWQQETSLDAHSTFTPGPPTGVWTFVRPNLYEPGRAHIVIYNWDLLSNVQVDLSASGIQAGDAFQIRDAENWFRGTLVSGTYTGAPVTIPMTGLQVAPPNGVVPNPQPHTAPQFGVFVLLSGDAMNIYQPDQSALRRGGAGRPHIVKSIR
jgi:hypothetical protein